MGLFRRKARVTTEEFCRQFYDTDIFNASIRGVDLWKGYCNTVFKLLVEADRSFAAVDRDRLQEEMTALRLELFAVAWMHRFKREQLILPQSLFTRRYLDEKGKLPIWDTMGEYNQAVARSATMTGTGRQVAGPFGRGRVALLNRMRLEMFERWADAVGEEHDGPGKEALKCVARVANRIGVDVTRPDCVLVRLLAARLADRVGCDVNLSSEALFRAAVVIYGLYQGAKEAINGVDLCRS